MKMTEKLPKLAIVVPCYYEEEVLPKTLKVIGGLLKDMIKQKEISGESVVCLVNDGSKDKTWQIIQKAAAKDKNIFGISLSRNFGHQKAIIAGMYECDADIYVTIDADLQDDCCAIREMLKKIKDGCDIVYGVRDSRDTDTIFKKYSALAFYKLMKLLGVNIVYNHADFRMMTRRAVNSLKEFPERNLFLRALVPLVGFKYDKVYYDRKAREAGETKYPLMKMLGFAWSGISSFSIVPLRLVTFTGFAVCFLSLIFMMYLLYGWAHGKTLVGWASLVTVITVFSGVQLLSLGVIGEYMAKIFIEVKHRPLYIIDEKTTLAK